MDGGNYGFGPLGQAAVVVLVALFVQLLLSRWLRIVPDEPDIRLSPLVRSLRQRFSAVWAILWLIAGLTVFVILLRAGAHLLAIALALPLLIGAGLALKDPLANVASGLLLTVRRPLKVGDLIEFDQAQGRITRLGIDHLTVAIGQGRIVRWPYRKLIQQGFQILSQDGGEFTVDVLLSIPSHVDLAKAKDAAYRSAILSRYASPHIRPEIFMDSDGDSIQLRVRGYVAHPDLRERYTSDIIETWLTVMRPALTGPRRSGGFIESDEEKGKKS